MLINYSDQYLINSSKHSKRVLFWEAELGKGTEWALSAWTSKPCPDKKDDLHLQ